MTTYTATDTFTVPVVGELTLRKLTRTEVIGLQKVTRKVAVAKTEEQRETAAKAAHAYDCKLIKDCASDWPKGEPDDYITLPEEAFSNIIEQLMRYSGFKIEGDPDPEPEDPQEALENLPETPTD